MWGAAAVRASVPPKWTTSMMVLSRGPLTLSSVQRECNRPLLVWLCPGTAGPDCLCKISGAKDSLGFMQQVWLPQEVGNPPPPHLSASLWPQSQSKDACRPSVGLEGAVCSRARIWSRTRVLWDLEAKSRNSRFSSSMLTTKRAILMATPPSWPTYTWWHNPINLSRGTLGYLCIPSTKDAIFFPKAAWQSP